jgi:hypothetical protein
VGVIGQEGIAERGVVMGCDGEFTINEFVQILPDILSDAFAHIHSALVFGYQEKEISILPNEFFAFDRQQVYFSLDIGDTFRL